MDEISYGINNVNTRNNHVTGVDIMGFLEKIFAGNVLYYPGCLTKFVAKDIEDNYKKILQKIGIDFIQLKDLEVCCGSPIFNAGHKKEAIELAEKNLKTFKEHGIKKIITSCPACYKTFSVDYPKLIKDWNIKVEHITITIDRAIKEKKISPKNLHLKFTYHDPCHLSKHCKIIKEPREILKNIGELKEMRLSGENSFCCGAGSGVKNNYKELANEIAIEKNKMIKETNCKTVITTCPMCYLHLKENSKDIEVKELSEVIK